MLFWREKLRDPGWLVPVLALTLACAALFAGETWIAQSRSQAMVSAAADQSRLLSSVESKVDGVGRSIELALGSIDQSIGRSGSESPLQDAMIAGISSRLRLVSDGMIALRLIDVDGGVYFYPYPEHPPRVNVRDREYFRLGLASAPGTLFFGVPIRSRLTGRWGLPLIRRLENRHEGIALACAVLDMESLSRFVGQVEPGHGDVVTLTRVDGTVLGRWPDSGSGAAIGHRSDLAPSGERLNSVRHGVFIQMISPMDGRRKLVSYATLERYSVVVTVSTPLAEILAATERTALLIRGGVAAFIVFELLALAAVWRLLQRLHRRESRLADVVREKTASMALLSQRTIDLEATRESLERLSITDPLTGLYNRRHFIDMVERTLAVAQREGQPLTLLYLDIDYFKHVNDNYGHVAGDVTLQVLAGVMRGGLRPGDDLARIGGEEFAILLPDAGIHQAQAVAERVRSEVEAKVVATGEGDVSVTISIGGAVASACDTPTSLLKRADSALYQAKQQGRNRVVFSADC
ncbi:sensor domain-containing diguanylate cyclase [Paludibacterium yongneupense]|uniref:sensor domain-containing diguanylate cyclase n=1 Tax=Paludibacterium yongneupense TaxID=400061 RepID=UPI000404450A|nr:sensor domain-containing diguanylate cyclase [Paludibacterium yongneupense]